MICIVKKKPKMKFIVIITLYNIWFGSCFI